MTTSNQTNLNYSNWIHPNNVCIEGNQIMKIGRSTGWTAAAFSEQYLKYGDDGCIQVKIPGLDDEGNKTCDWTQQFFIGFSDGANDPDYQKNIVGVRIQQYTRYKGDKTPRMALEIYQQCGHISKTNPVYPGQEISIYIKHNLNKKANIDTLGWRVEWNNLDANNVKMSFNGTVCDAHKHNPLVAKIALFSGSKVVGKVKLIGDWKTAAVCNEAPYSENCPE